MPIDYKNINWLLLGSPRPVQLEALSRSYLGIAHRNVLSDEDQPHQFNGEGPLKGYALFLEMRSGKSSILLNEYLMLKRQGLVNKLFIIAPNKFKEGWVTEAKKFGVIDPIHAFESTKRPAAIKFIENGGEVIVTNYESLLSDANMSIFEDFVDRNTLIAADESVKIKNRSTQFFKNAMILRKQAEYARILTGKPVVQGPHDLYSQLRFIGELDGFNFYAYRNKFCKMGGFKGKQVVGAKNEDQLHQILNRCAFVAKRSDWSTTFSVDYEIRKIEMLPDQRELYLAMEEEFMIWLSQEKAVTVDQVITKHIKLQQISSGFIIDEDGKTHVLVPPRKLPKFVELLDSLENEIIGKTIVVVYHQYAVDMLYEQLINEFNPALICGSDKMRKLGLSVEDEKEKFNNDPKCRVLIGQVSAIKYGHNLMGSKDDPCLTTIYYENTYNLDDRSQSEQRNQGVDQTTGTFIIDYASSPVESSITLGLQRKERISDRILHYYGRPAIESR